MALRRNSLIAAVMALVASASVAMAEDDIYNYESRSDFVRLSTGDAAQSNISIQHPTPWPSYVNDTDIDTTARQGVSALEKMFKRYEGGSAQSPSTVINVGVK